MQSIKRHHLNNKLRQLWLRPQIGEHIVPDVSSLLQGQTARRPSGSVDWSCNEVARLQNRPAILIVIHSLLF